MPPAWRTSRDWREQVNEALAADAQRDADRAEELLNTHAGLDAVRADARDRLIEIKGELNEITREFVTDPEDGGLIVSREAKVRFAELLDESKALRDIITGAPAALDTLREIGEAMGQTQRAGAGSISIQAAGDVHLNFGSDPGAEAIRAELAAAHGRATGREALRKHYASDEPTGTPLQRAERAQRDANRVLQRAQSAHQTQVYVTGGFAAVFALVEAGLIGLGIAGAFVTGMPSSGFFILALIGFAAGIVPTGRQLGKLSATRALMLEAGDNYSDAFDLVTELDPDRFVIKKLTDETLR